MHRSHLPRALRWHQLNVTHPRAGLGFPGAAPGTLQSSMAAAAVYWQHRVPEEMSLGQGTRVPERGELRCQAGHAVLPVTPCPCPQPGSGPSTLACAWQRCDTRSVTEPEATELGSRDNILPYPRSQPAPAHPQGSVAWPALGAHPPTGAQVTETRPEGGDSSRAGDVWQGRVHGEDEAGDWVIVSGECW